MDGGQEELAKSIITMYRHRLGPMDLMMPPSWQNTINPIGRDKTDEHLVFNAEPHRKISAALSWLAADGKDEEQTDGMIATEAIKLMEEKRENLSLSQPAFFVHIHLS